jgi:fructose-1,6-bisphosphatase/inositol monophosphatase family enzyme
MTDPRDEISIDTRQELLDAALQFADLCAETTASIVGAGFDVSTKADESLVTTADVETERAFRGRVAERFPHMAILGEELGDSDENSDYRWIIDPIDGTAEFARHVPLYGCIIALHYKGQPLVGVIDHRAMQLRCHGAYGLGAFANGERVRIEDCTSAEAAAGARIGLPSRASFLKPTDSSAVFSAIVSAYPNFRAYHTCYAHTLAVLGGLDAAMEWDTPLWDLAATQILVEEAGGRYQSVRDIDIPGRGRFYSAVYGKPTLVNRLVAIIKDALITA